MVGHVSFDFWNTLAKSNPDYTQARNALLIEHFGEENNPVEVYKLHKKIFDAHQEIMGISYSAGDFYFFLCHYMKIECYHNKWTDFFIKLSEIIKNNPPIIDDNVVQAVKKLYNSGINLSIVSNTLMIDGIHLEPIIESKLKYFTYYYFSNEKSYSKPHVWYEILDRGMDIPHWMNSIDIHVGDNKINDGKCVHAAIEYHHVSSPDDINDDFVDKILSIVKSNEEYA